MILGAPWQLVAFTATNLLIGYLVIAATFCAGVRAGRFIERAKRGGW